MAREDKSQCIILAVAGVGESHLSQQRSEESTWRAQSVYTQGVVRSVLIGPLSVVYKSRWQSVQVEVAHAVRANHHCCILLVEGIHNLLQCLWRRVEVVRVKLYGKSSAVVIVYSCVPASAYSQVVALGDYMYKSLVVESTQQLCCSVSRVVVHHNNVELEFRLLTQCAVHRVADGLLAVVNGNNHRSLYVELLLVEVGCAIERWVDLCSDCGQMSRSGMLHLYLYLAVARVHVVKLLLARCSGVGLLLGIQLLVYVEYASFAAQEKSQGINCSKLICVFAGLRCKGIKQRCLYQNQRSQVEVVAYATYLIVDNGVWLQLSVDKVVVVGINHCSVRVACYSQHAVKRAFSHLYLSWTYLQQSVVGFCILSYSRNGSAACKVVNYYLLAVA